MAATHEKIHQNIEQIVKKSPNGVGWHGAEMRCAIPRSDFPEGMNVQVVLESMTEAGTLIKKGEDGKEGYFAAGPDLSNRSS
jgi:hypothetical protein